jgi:hypothetical protein
MFKNEKTFKGTVQNAEIFQAFLFPLLFSSFFFWSGFSNPRIFIYGSGIVAVLCLISVFLPTIYPTEEKKSILRREQELRIRREPELCINGTSKGTGVQYVRTIKNLSFNSGKNV